jgi:hypothetical protein
MVEEKIYTMYKGLLEKEKFCEDASKVLKVKPRSLLLQFNTKKISKKNQEKALKILQIQTKFDNAVRELKVECEILIKKENDN